MEYKRLSIHLSYLLRHAPDSIGLQMDEHGWVDVQELSRRVNEAGKHRLTRQLLEQIVADDEKGRYRFSEDGTRIKACQGHSIEWVEPELTCWVRYSERPRMSVEYRVLEPVYTGSR